LPVATRATFNAASYRPGIEEFAWEKQSCQRGLMTFGRKLFQLFARYFSLTGQGICQMADRRLKCSHGVAAQALIVNAIERRSRGNKVVNRGVVQRPGNSEKIRYWSLKLREFGRQESYGLGDSSGGPLSGLLSRSHNHQVGLQRGRIPTCTRGKAQTCLRAAAPGYPSVSSGGPPLTDNARNHSS